MPFFLIFLISFFCSCLTTYSFSLFSGGVDSASTIGLAKAASKKPGLIIVVHWHLVFELTLICVIFIVFSGSPITKVLGICQPIQSTASIWQRAIDVCSTLQCECITVDQSDINIQLQTKVETAMNMQSNQFAVSFLCVVPVHFSSLCLVACGFPFPLSSVWFLFSVFNFSCLISSLLSLSLARTTSFLSKNARGLLCGASSCR